MLGRGARVGFLALVALACIGPVAWVVLSSFKTQSQIFGRGDLLPEPVQPRRLPGAVHADRRHGVPAQHAAVRSAAAPPGALAVALLAAYPAARLRFPFRRALTVLFSAGLAIPIAGLIVPEFVIMRDLGLFDSRAGMVVFYSAMWFPLAFVILRVYLSGLPPQLEEAAALDGARYFQLLRYVIVCRSRGRGWPPRA